MSGAGEMKRSLDVTKLPEFAPDPALWSRIVAAHEAVEAGRAAGNVVMRVA